MHIARHYTELIKMAREVEEDGELEKAAEYYEQAIRQGPMEEFPYQRLMVIYRKFKEYKKELKVINKAIDVFTGYYDKAPERIFGKNAAALKTGRALLRSISGKKPATYYPEPIPKWLKRKEAVEKKA